MTTTSNVEKSNTHLHDEQSWERPLSVYSRTTDEDTHHPDLEKAASSHHDITPAVTVGEPSGNLCPPPARPTQSRTSSTRTRIISVVPRNKRRGLLGSLTLIPEVERPHDYKNSTKWSITAVIAIAAACAPIGSSIFYRRFIISPPLRICACRYQAHRFPQRPWAPSARTLASRRP